MKQKDYNPIRSKTPVFQKQKISDQHIITVPYIRDPFSAVEKLPSLETEKVCCRTSSQSIIHGERKFAKADIKLDSPINKPIAKLKTPTYPTIISPKVIDKNFEGANQDFEFIKSSPISRLKKTPGNPIAELESKGKKNVDKVNEDDPPFNFQGMLRKTNYKRDSMKSKEEIITEAPYTNVLKKTTKSDDIFENAKDEENEKEKEKYDENTVRCEVAPGIFLEGTEAEL